MHKVTVTTFAFALLLLSCSDQGDNPTDPGTDPASLIVNDVQITEGQDAVFSIVLGAAAETNVIFTYRTSDGTATNGNDYNGVASTRDTIPVGSNSTAVSISTIQDTNVEPDETFSLIVTMISGGNVADSVGVAMIDDDDGVSFADSVQPILKGSCAKAAPCHAPQNPDNAGGGMYLGPSASYNSVISATGDGTAIVIRSDGKVVVPGKADSSSLYLKTTSNPPFGSRMPLSGGFLTIDQQNRIRDWINQGALNN